MENKYFFKIAETEREYELIARLNYETFVMEIPQHERNEEEMLQDKYHNENTYFICMEGDELSGMITLRDKRPFSLDYKLPNLNDYFSPELKICEARLLSVKKHKRSGTIAMHLIRIAGEFFLANHYDLIIISGIINQLKLYSKIGLMPFGPIVGTGAAQYQPMYLTHEYARIILPDVVIKDYIKIEATDDINYLPGPVNHDETASKGLAHKAVSHRGVDYKLLLDRVKWQLKKLSNAQHVQLFLGSGTLVNDVIAGQLSLLNAPGIILTNGEFGNRLKTNADGFGLDYITFFAPYGEDFDLQQLDKYMEEHKYIKWLWFVHLETSSGIVNDYEGILQVAAKYQLKVCADCISSLGNVPLDLSQFYFASSVAGKGLCSYTGLSMVFYNHELTKPKLPLPSYMDLWKYEHLDGIPYSGNSNLLRALHQALENTDFEKRIRDIKDVFTWSRNEIRKTGTYIINNGDSGNVVLSIKLPVSVSSYETGTALEFRGYKMHFKSSFLRNNNILQIAFMGADSLNKSEEMVKQLKKHIVEGVRIA